MPNDLNTVRFVYDEPDMKLVVGLCDPWVQDAIKRARANAARAIIAGGHGDMLLEEFLPPYAVKHVETALSIVFKKADRLDEQADTPKPKTYKAARKVHGRVSRLPKAAAVADQPTKKGKKRR